MYESLITPPAVAPAATNGVNPSIDAALAAEGVSGREAEFIKSIYQQESGSGANAKTSNAGAVGGMQIIPSTFRSVADQGWDINNPDHNLRAGIRYARQGYKESGGDPVLAGAFYYGGPGGMAKARDGVAVSDPRNPNAPNTLQYGAQVAKRMGAAPAAAAATAPSDAPYFTPASGGYASLITPPPLARTTIEAAKDVALGAGAGVVQGVEMVASAFGADNAVARGANDAAQGLIDMQSPARKQQREQRAAAIQEAETSGSTWAEIVANVGAFTDAPVESALNAIGTSVPTLMTALIPGLGQANVARLVVQGAMGAAQGAGAVKGSIYEAVERELSKPGPGALSKDDAKKAAAAAQAYDSQNGGDIAFGALIGWAAGTTGIEKSLSRILSKEGAEAAAAGVLKRTAMGIAGEAPMEGLQGGQERLAANRALQNEGVDVPTWRGVAGSAAGEAMASVVPGGVFGAMRPSRPELPPELKPVAEKAAEPNSPLSKAAMAANTPEVVAQREAQRQAAEPAAAPANANTAARLAELESIGEGRPAQTIKDDQGRDVEIPAEPGRFFTPEEKAEYDDLTSRRDATPGAKPKEADAIGDRAKEIASSIRESGALEVLRSPDTPVKVADLLRDLSVAQSPNTPAATREQALGRVEFALQWAGIDVSQRTSIRDNKELTSSAQQREGAASLADLANSWDVANRSGRSDAWFEGAHANEDSRAGFNDALLAGGADIRAHGMAKERTLSGGISNLLSLLRNGLDSGRGEGRLHYAPLVADRNGPRDGTTPSGSAYADGPFILLARPGEEFTGMLSGVGAILVNPSHADIVPALREAVNAIRPDILVESYGASGDVVRSMLNDPGRGAASRVDPVIAAMSDTKVSAADKSALRDAYNTALNVRLPQATRDQALAAAREIAGRYAVPPAAAPAAEAKTPAVLGPIDGAPGTLLAQAERMEEGAFELEAVDFPDEAKQLRDQADSLREQAATVRAGETGQELEADAPADTVSPEAQQLVTLPTAKSTPAGDGPAYQRRRRASLQQLAANGFTTVRRDGDKFAMVNPKTGQVFNLDNAADAQLARKAIADNISAAAAQTNTDPTDGQKSAGNYKKARVDFDGVTIAIENPVGSERKGKSDNGEAWATPMNLAHYGYLPGTTASDLDGVDVYLLNTPRLGGQAYVIDQYNEDGTFDETKTVLGASSEAEALRVYDAGFSDGSGPDRRGAVTAMPIADFKAWAFSPAAKKPAGPAPEPAPGAVVDGTMKVKISKDESVSIDLVKELPEVESVARGGRATRISKKQGAVIEAIAQAFGKRVQFYTGTDSGRVGDGFIMPNDPDTIYLNATSSMSPIVVFGHELMHQLKRDNPEAHAAIEAVVARRMNREAVATTYGKLGYSDGQVMEELISDLGGDLMADKTFWADVMAEVRDANGDGPAKKILAQLAEFLYRAIGAMTKNLRSYADTGAGSRLVDDMTEIRAAFQTALAGYMQTHGISKPAMQAEILRAGQDAKRSAARLDQAQAAIKSGVTETPEFKAWFGDSKVVDADGKPLVVYHGTRSDVSEFDRRSIGSATDEGFLGDGFYFTDSKRAASAFAKGEGGNVIAAYVSIKNPYYADGLLPDSLTAESLQASGFDGVIYQTDGNGDYSEFVAFRPEQIKSAIGNNGTFDPNDANITRSANRQTDTPEFKAWFGDSMVVDAGGKPLVVYHGTNRRFTKFSDKKSGGNFEASEGAFFFTPERAFAEQMADFATEANESGRPAVMSVFLSLQNPMVRDLKGENVDVALEVFDAKEAGHDSLILLNALDSMPAWPETQYIAFRPEQIKSATGNNGAFDPSNADITRSADRSDALTVEGYHFSKEPRKMLSSLMYGTGLQGSDREAIQRYPDERLRQRISFYVNKGTGINPEAGVGGYAHRATLENVYDSNADVKRLRQGRDKRAFESAVLDAGYDGYLDRLEGTQPGQVIMLGRRSIQPELVGQRSFINNAKPVPAPVAREMDLADRITSNKALPAGKIEPERWKQYLQRMMPVEAAELEGVDVFEGSKAIYKDELVSRIRAAMAPAIASRLRDDPMEVSSRAPWGKTSAEDPIADLLVVGLDSSRAGEKAFEKNVALVREYPNYRPAKSASTTELQADRFIEATKDNLLWLYDQVPAEIRERSHLWYDGANKIAKTWAPKYDLQPAQIAGVMAVLSPQKDWFMNVDLARRVIDTMDAQGNTRWNAEMTATARRIFGKPQYADDVKAITSKTLDEVNDLALKAMWVRAYDETYNDRAHALLSPEGDVMGKVQTQKGENAKVAWGDLGSISKAVAIIQDGKLTNISARLGGEHKVRNFYNNILVPNGANGHVTIDTHAVAAALLRPLSGSSLEVLHNFGSAGAASSAIHGSSGTYGLYAEAYRRAAAERGVLAREMQSITWEAVRGLFTPGFKSQQKNVDATDAIWENYRKGRLSLENARQQILDAAGGIEQPSWFRSGAGSPAQEGRGDAGVVPGVQLPGRRAESAAGGARGPAAEAAAVQRSANRDGSEQQLAADQALPGSPRVEGATGPDPRLVAVAEAYAQKVGIDFSRQAEYVQVDEKRAARIAKAYEAMEHAPQDRKVKAAYADLIKQTRAQYDALIEAGYSFYFADQTNDPYAGNPWNAMRDLRANQQMAVFPTAAGFGSNETFDPADNPLLADTGLVWGYGSPDGKGMRVLANDLFRAVHDAFGHGLEGAGFRAQGEENAWQGHIRMFTGAAKGAITSETRGQNSWLNYNATSGEDNRTAKVEDTIFADQKTGLMPEWTWTDGVAADMPAQRSASRDLPKATMADFESRGISRLLGVDNWAILTAENPMGEQAGEKTNAAAMRKLRQRLADMDGVEFRAIRGKYGDNEENSLAVVGITEEQAVELGREFNQDSVLTRKGFIYQDGSINPATGIEVFRNAPDNYYSRIGDTIFRIDIDFDTTISPEVARARRPGSYAPSAGLSDGDLATTIEPRAERNAELVELRKRLSVLDSIARCMTS